MSILKQGKTGVPSKAYPILSRIRGLRRMTSMLKSLKHFSESEVAQERSRIINFYGKHGETATKEAFNVDRKLIYVWKKKIKKNKGRLFSLIPISTTSKKKREMETHSRVVDFIKNIRDQHYRLGKEKIKPLLDEYCLKNSLPTIAEPTIGKVIKRHNLFFQKQGRIYHDPESKWVQNQAKSKKRLRIKHSPKPKDFGHIQSDTVERITDGIRDYFYSAIDIRMKFSFSVNYKSSNSRNNKDFYHKFKSVYPGRKIKDWQTDNGAENLGDFEKELEKDNVPHIFTYPRCPRINGVIERYNRTLQEEFINPNLYLIHDKILFSHKLAEYIIFYNTKRVHKTLGNISPMDFLISKGLMSNKSVSYTGT